jgi:hypothetical protein
MFTTLRLHTKTEVVTASAIALHVGPMALGLLRVLHEKGRRLPAAVSVVGFDDIPEAAFFTPPLTTIRQDFLQVGRSGFELLLEEMGPRQPLLDTRHGRPAADRAREHRAAAGLEARREGRRAPLPSSPSIQNPAAGRPTAGGSCSPTSSRNGGYSGVISVAYAATRKTQRFKPTISSNTPRG